MLLFVTLYLDTTNSRPVAILLRLRDLEHDALGRHASRGATIAPNLSNTKLVVPNTRRKAGLLGTTTHILPIHERRLIARSFSSTHIHHFIIYLDILFFLCNGLLKVLNVCVLGFAAERTLGSVGALATSLPAAGRPS